MACQNGMFGSSGKTLLVWTTDFRRTRWIALLFVLGPVCWPHLRSSFKTDSGSPSRPKPPDFEGTPTRILLFSAFFGSAKFPLAENLLKLSSACQHKPELPARFSFPWEPGHESKSGWEFRLCQHRIIANKSYSSCGNGWERFREGYRWIIEKLMILWETKRNGTLCSGSIMSQSWLIRERHFGLRLVCHLHQTESDQKAISKQREEHNKRTACW